MRAKTRATPARATLLVAAGLLSFTYAHAQQKESAAAPFPTKPVRIVVPSAPGGGTDLVARYVAQALSDSWSQTVIVDNRSGGATTIGTHIVAKAQPDGHTMLLTTVNFAFSPAIHQKLPYHPERDFSPVVMLATSDSVLAVNNDVPARSVGELVALARSRPGELRYASGGNGTVGHLVGELFQLQARVKLAHIPYKGTGPGLAALNSGEVHLLIANIASMLPHMKAGRVRGLAVTGAERVRAVPDLPTIAEAGVPGYEYSGWYGVWTPAKTPPAIISRLNADLNRVVQAPAFAARFRVAAIAARGGTSAEFAAYLKSELNKWNEVARTGGIRLDL